MSMSMSMSMGYRSAVGWAFLSHQHRIAVQVVPLRSYYAFYRPFGVSTRRYATSSKNDDDITLKSITSKNLWYPHFVFGYGSLICPDSRAITAPTVADRIALPVCVRGVERTWAKKSQVSRATSMGVQFRDSATCVGVLVPVDNQELQAFDKREIGYNRHEIKLNNIEPVPHLLVGDDADSYYRNTFLDKAFYLDSEQQLPQVWIYVQQDPVPASPEYPIAQSYLDIMLRGCFTISDDFAHEFIQSTKGWHPAELTNDDAIDEDSSISSDDSTITITITTTDMEQEGWWVDDRTDPLYVRADPNYSQEHQHKIDRLLHEKIPARLNSRIRRGRSQITNANGSNNNNPNKKAS